MLYFALGVIAGVLLAGVGAYTGLQVFLAVQEGVDRGVMEVRAPSFKRESRPDNKKALKYRSLEYLSEIEQEVLRGRKQGGTGVS